MKKSVLILACLCAAFVMFTGCSSDGGDSGYQPIFLPNNEIQKVYYKLTLDANGGKGSTSYDKIEANHQFALEKAQSLGVTRSDYTFLGWARSSDARTATYADGGTVVVNANITLYAVWKKNSETKSNTEQDNQAKNQTETKPTTENNSETTPSTESNPGTSSSPQTESQTENQSGSTPTAESNPGTSTNPQTENQSGSTPATESNPGTQAGEVNPPPVNYTVTFDTNGGTSINPATVESGSRVNKPSQPTKTGYTFAGWYADRNLTTTYDFTSNVSDDITVYAKWNVIEYSIEYELNGGSWKSNNARESFTVEDSFVLPGAEDLTKTGYGFTGWHEKSNLSDDAVLQIQKGTTGKKKYYASWEAGTVNYTVRHLKQNLSKNGYDEALSDKQVLTGKTNGQTSASALSYEGFTAQEFSQIAIKADGTSEICIYYSRNSYTVTFDTNGGSNISDRTITYGQSVTEPTAPTKVGFVFKGWYTSSNFSSPYTFGSTISGNITLYAKWQNTAGISVTVLPNSTVAINPTYTGSTITLTATSGHSSYSWKIDDSAAASFEGASVSGNTLTITKSALVTGWRYQISLYAPKGGIPYSAQIAVKKGE